MSNKGQHFLGDVYHFAAVSQNVNKIFSCLPVFLVCHVHFTSPCIHANL